MLNDRPTFHEAWYRVADLKPRLLSNVSTYRQHFRGQLWYVLENSTNNKFSRLSQDAYYFVGLLDGKRSVAEAWQLSNQQQGDRAPTQGEVIQLLGQLYSSNLLYAELPPDAANLLDRYTKRVTRQIRGFFSNLLFIRIPLYDPDRLLDKWVFLVGKAFSKTGLAIWISVLITGVFFVVSNLKELINQSRDVLAPDNLFLLYLSMVFIKVFHEFGHSFACKAFGRRNGSGGQVHVMGVMFLVFLPLPYMDASSAWAFRKKSHRVIVGLSGMMVELFIASVAAVVWANTSTGTLHIIAHNMIFIASVSSLLFNGNPLLRFDAYYVLSDLVEIPNLGQRSRHYLYYLVRKYLWKVRSASNPAHNSGEKGWFLFYGIASTTYRIFISIRILMFLNDRLPRELFFLVPLFALSAVISWVLIPLGRFIHYLMAGTELARTRLRAVGSTFAFAAGLFLLLGVWKVPDYCRVEGIIDSRDLNTVYASSDGFVESILPSGCPITAGQGTPMFEAVNVLLMTEETALLAELDLLRAKERIASTEEVAAAQMIREQISALQEQIQRVQYEISTLRLEPEISGTWISPDFERMKGVYLRRGDPVGVIVPPDTLLIRAMAGQNLAAILLEQHQGNVAIRPKGRPDIEWDGTIEKIFPAGQEILPSQALGYAAGGSIATQTDDPSGRKSTEKFFEVWIRPDIDSSQTLLLGQRVIARVRLQSKPLALQWWLELRQLFQRRFHI
jgi:putative peptide zinc metalloprotease protein